MRGFYPIEFCASRPFFEEHEALGRGHRQQQPTKGGGYTFLSEGNFDEVNFWQPSGRAPFSNLPAGTPFLFKLKAPNNHIAGRKFGVSLPRPIPGLTREPG